MAKQLVIDFFKSDAMINSNSIKEFIHPDIIVEWNHSEGKTTLNYESIIDLSNVLSKAYINKKVIISHIVEETNLVSVRYQIFVKTIENPTEEFLLGYFITIWEIKDQKLFRGFQISQKA